MKKLVFLALILPVMGMTCQGVPVNECSLSPPARCAIEFKFENKFNTLADSIGSASRVDYDIMCPDGATCPDPVFGGDETGDFEVEVIEVRP